jgi:response regulator RpfG family c-di-GMP phosphodiesterase
VDDERGILAALQRTLRREGYEILTAGSAAAARRLLDEQPVDLVLSDQKLPGSSGLEILREAARRRPEAARLLITGWPDEVPAAELQRLGIRALIPKPWDAETLKKALRDAL